MSDSALLSSKALSEQTEGALVLLTDEHGRASVFDAAESALLVGSVTGNRIDLVFTPPAGVDADFTLTGEARLGEFRVSGRGSLRIGALRFDEADITATQSGLLIAASIQWDTTQEILALAPRRHGKWAGSVQIDEHFRCPITGPTHLPVSLEVSCASSTGARIAVNARAELDGNRFDIAIDRESFDDNLSGLRQHVRNELSRLLIIEAERLESDLDAILDEGENAFQIETPAFEFEPPQLAPSSLNREQSTGVNPGGPAASSYLSPTGYMDLSATKARPTSGYLDSVPGGYLASHASAEGTLRPLSTPGVVEPYSHIAQSPAKSSQLILNSSAQIISVRLLRTKEIIHELRCESVCKPHLMS